MELIDLKQSMEVGLDLLRMGKNDEILFYIFKFLFYTTRLETIFTYFHIFTYIYTFIYINK